MDKKSFKHRSYKDSIPSTMSDLNCEKKNPVKDNELSSNEKGSVKKKSKSKSSFQPYSPEKPSSTGGKSKVRKKKSDINLEDSLYAVSSSPKSGRNPKEQVTQETNSEYSDLLAKMNSSDNMRKGSKQSRRSSVPNNSSPEVRSLNNAHLNQSPSSSKTGGTGYKSQSKFRSKTPDSKAGACGFSGQKHFSAKKSIKFEPYIPLFQVQQGLKRGEFIEGALRINPRNYEDAYVSSPDGKMDIYIGGMQNRNRALNGDIVVVQINPKQEWKVLCDAIKDYQEKCGKTFVETICEPVPPIAPCKVHTPDPFVRPRPLSSNSWDNSRFQRSPDTLEILGIDRLAKQFENISVKQKTSPKSKIKKKSKDAKGKQNGSQKSSTASYSQESSEDCLDRVSPEHKFTEDNEKISTISGFENHSSLQAESGITSQDFLNGQTYSPCDMNNIGEFHVEDEVNHADNKWIANENSVNLIISPEELLQFDGNSILNNSDFHQSENIDNCCDFAGVVVPPGDLSGDEFTDSASINSSIGENLDKVLEDSEFLACQQDAENNNVDIIPQQFETVNNFTSYNIPVQMTSVSAETLNNFTSYNIPAQMTSISTDRSSLDAQCKIQFNKSAVPIPTFDVNAEVVCVSEFIPRDEVNVEENLDQLQITHFQVPPNIKENNNDSNQITNTKKPRHRRRKKKTSSSKNTSMKEEINNFTKTFEDIHNLTIDQVMQHPEWYRFVQKTGKVVHILERKHSCLAAGNLKLLPDKNVKWALFSPTDSRVPRILIPMSDCPPNFYNRSFDYSNVLFLAEILEWEDKSNYASGRLVKELGSSCDVEVQTEGILIENGIDYSEDFNEDVLSCLPTDENWTVPKAEIKSRRDFRHKCIFTIDPASARDMDDAMSCELLHNGNYEVGVHIADVTYFVPEESELDEAAKHRSTSVYLVQKVVPMLPRKLCDDLCSLNPGKDRLTFSVVWEMSPEGEILDRWIGRSVINSCVKLSYEHAQDMIENPSRKWNESEHPPIYGAFTIKDVIKRVGELNSLAVKLREKRFMNGALRLDQVKLEFALDDDRSSPLGFNVYVQKDSNKLIEEFMLLANMTVAETIYETFPKLSLLRRHPVPSPKPMLDVVTMCESMGIILDATSSGTLQSSIAYYKGDDDLSNAIVQVLMNLCSKPMNCALYFCTGVLEDVHLYRHYALNVPLYTHFTSPIRRYPDVIVHRLLGAALGYNSVPNMTAVEMEKCAKHSNDRKYNAKRISDLSAELFLAAFIRNLGSVYTRGMVVNVMDHSFDCLILDMGVIKRVYCDKLPLMKKEYKRSHGVSTLNLTWKDESVKEGIKQTIVLFTLVNVVMNVEKDSLQIKVSLLKPDCIYVE